ncbi:hypothetical protein ZIOFF_053891 [Zingiber officinale]|uniref:Uncharacterized protein n=1 Tax=Zingiber officinale TaxID=94328 RepID=A0A8J5F8J1_ZINOF|nr:hypothetical protein ZIOFF_053891 [Zingiber officinale]
MELVKGVKEYCHPRTSRTNGTHPQWLFITLRDFLNMVDNACANIMWNLQKKKKSPTELLAGEKRNINVR